MCLQNLERRVQKHDCSVSAHFKGTDGDLGKDGKDKSNSIENQKEQRGATLISVDSGSGYNITPLRFE